MIYADKNGVAIKPGDILKYVVHNELSDAYQSIDVVIEHDGELWGIEKIGNPPNWELREDWDPIELKYYTASLNDSIINDAEIIGNTKDNPELLTTTAAGFIFNKE